MDDQHLRLIEAIVFASPAPVPERVLAGRLPEGTDLAALLLNLDGLNRVGEPQHDGDEEGGGEAEYHHADALAPKVPQEGRAEAAHDW